MTIGELEDQLALIRDRIAAADLSLAALAVRRDEHSFGAVTGDADAKAALLEIAEKATAIDAERMTLTAALAEGERRLEAAEARAAAFAHLGRVRAAASLRDEMIAAAGEFDAALKTAADRLRQFQAVAEAAAREPLLVGSNFGHAASPNALQLAQVEAGWPGLPYPDGSGTSLAETVRSHVRLERSAGRLLDADAR